MTTAHLSDETALYDRARANPAGYRDIDPVSVAHGDKSFRWIDVREPDELAGELGRIAGVENVPLAVLEHAARGWNKHQEIVVVCRSGGRSGRAAAYLTSVGFTRVMNMSGGMLAWNEAKLPVSR